jgi:hypothetical protein
MCDIGGQPQHKTTSCVAMDRMEYNKRACERIVIDFLNYIDHKRFQEAADLFAGDGIWIRLNDVLTGPEHIFQVIASRPTAQCERHVVSNIQLAAPKDGTMIAIAYVMTFRTITDSEAVVPVIPGPSGLADFRYEFHCQENTWKIRHLSSRPVFAFTR